MNIIISFKLVFMIFKLEYSIFLITSREIIRELVPK